jgi:hypothetical protein
VDVATLAEGATLSDKVQFICTGNPHLRKGLCLAFHAASASSLFAANCSFGVSMNSWINEWIKSIINGVNSQ